MKNEAVALTFSEERLVHFQCGSCGGWWSIADAPKDRYEWHCPWCGVHQQCSHR